MHIFPLRPVPAIHQLDINQPGSFGNASLFVAADKSVALTHHSLVTVDVHINCEHEVAIERDLAVQLDKGDSGGLMDGGQSKFISGPRQRFVSTYS